jgi:hypothetical protein
VSRNPNAVWAFLLALAALAVLGGALAAAHYSSYVDLYRGIAAVPVGFLLAFFAIRMARRARLEYDRSLGRSGGRGLATAARILGGFALLLAITGALALGVFAVLTLASR